MEQVKVPGYGTDGSYVELDDSVEIHDEQGNPNSADDDWAPSRWELWDGDELIWRVDYSGVANPWEANPKQAARRKLEWFAALYSLGKRGTGDRDTSN